MAIEAYKSCTASTYPEPEDKEIFVRHQLYKEVEAEKVARKLIRNRDK